MRRLLVISILLLLGLGVGGSAASAQISADEEPPDFPEISEIVATINVTGRYVDPAAIGDDSDVDAAITRANAAGIAVMLADPALNLEVITPLIDEQMRASGSDYTAILSLTPMQIAAEVADLSSLELNEAFDAFEEGFVTGGDAGAIDAFTDSVTGADGITSGGLDSNTDSGTDTSTDSSTDDGTATSESDSSGGFPWFWSILAAVAGFFGIRYFSNKRKRKAAEQAAIEVDRSEIAEQLRNNADRVIDLGDPVIATGDASLISLYEDASTTYQEVSLALPKATTAAEIDALDDRIDEAEWQFEVIAARLAGEPEPPSPAERERAANPPAPTGPALGPDESVFDDSRRGRTTTQAPRPRSQPTSRRSSGGGLGGGLGGMLGGILGQILLGGGRPRQTSRRTQRRTASSGSWGSSPGRSMNDPFSRTRRSPTRRSAPRRTSTRRASGSRTRSSSSRRAGGSRSRGGGSRRR